MARRKAKAKAKRPAFKLKRVGTIAGKPVYHRVKNVRRRKKSARNVAMDA